MALRSTWFVLLVAALMGCAGRRAGVPQAVAVADRTALGEPIVVRPVEARCAPPAEWVKQPLKQSKTHIHQVWLSPTGNTAYGVIRFGLPLPVGPDVVLYFFLREMRRSEGDAHVLGQRRDAELNGLRFVAVGGKYVVRTNLTTQGFRGWAVYAGTLRGRDILPSELSLAELAREQTETGVDGNPGAARP